MPIVVASLRRSTFALVYGLFLVLTLHSLEPNKESETVPDPVQQAEALRSTFLDDRPSSLFSAKLGDDSIELFLKGYWKTAINPSLAGPGAASLSDYANLPWTNDVSLLLSLWYARTWFLDVQVSEELEATTFALGYQNLENEGLRRLAIGNAGIGTITPYYGFSFGSAIDGIPGIALSFGDKGSSFDVLLRLQNTQDHEEVFLGSNLSSDAIKHSTDFLQGKAFQLPHQNIANLRLWLESSTGTVASDGRTYRELNAGDIAGINVVDGIIVLKLPASGRLLANYSVGGSSWSSLNGTVPFPIINLPGTWDFSTSIIFDAASNLSSFNSNIGSPLAQWYGRTNPVGIGGHSVSIGGTSSLVLYNPGEIGPFDILAWYATQGNTSTNNGQNLSNESLTQAIILEQDATTILRLYGTVSEQAILLPGDNHSLLGRYPLLVLGNARASEIYSPAKSQKLNLRLHFPSQSSSRDTITLQKAVIRESIQIWRNNARDNSFSYDAQSNSLKTNSPILGDDVIRVRYQTVDRLGSSRILQALIGGNFMLDQAGNLQVAIGTALNVSDTASNTNNNPNTGIVSQTAAYTWQDQNHQLSIQESLALLIPDLQGQTQINDFSDNHLPIILTPDRLQAAVPSASFLTNNRGEQAFRNFASNGTFLPWSSSAAPVARPYAQGEAIGPSIAGNDSSDPSYGNVLYLPFSMSAGQWVGAGIRLNDSERKTLRQASHLRFWIRGVAISANLTITINAGLPTEDQDSDGFLDRESNSSGQGIRFNDSSRGITLQALSQASLSTREQGEDRNANGFLDQSRTLWTPPSSAWDPSANHIGSFITEVLIPLDDQARSILQQADLIQLIIASSGTATSGTIIAGGFSFDGAGLNLSPNDSSIRAIVQSAPASITNTSDLVQSFGDAATAINQDSNNSILEIATSSAGTFSISKALSNQPLANYKTLLLHIRVSASTAITGLSFINSAGNSLWQSGAFTIPAGTWMQIRLDKQNQRLSLISPSGTEVANTSWTGYDSEPSAYLKIDFTSSVATSLWLDALIAKDSRSSIEASIIARYRYFYEQALWKVDDFELIGSLEFLILGQYNLRSELESTNPVVQSSTVDVSLKTRILSSDLEIGLKFTSDLKNSQLRGQHRLVIPTQSVGPIHLEDRYSQGLDQSGLPALQHYSALGLQLPGILNIGASLDLQQKSSLIQKDWFVWLKTVDVPGFNLSLETKINERAPGTNSLSNLYFENWLNSWSTMALLDEGNKISRSSKASFHVEGIAAPLTIMADLKAASTKGEFAGHDTQHEFGYSLELALGEKETSWYGSLKVISTGKTEQNLGLNSTLGPELADWAFDFSQSPNFWVPIPIWSVFDSSWPYDYPSSAKYSSTPSMGLSLSRPSAVTSIDYFLPRSLDLEIIRNYSAGTLEQLDTLGMRSSLGFKSLNLFGRSGASPVFDIFDSDAHGTIIRLEKLNINDSNWLLSYTGTTQIFGLADQNPYLQWKNAPGTVKSLQEIPEPFSLSIKGNAFFKFGATTGTLISLGFVYNWLSEMDTSLDIRSDQKRESPQFLAHQEELGFGFVEGSLGTAPPSGVGYIPNGAGWRIHLSHKSTWFLPTLGYISLGIRAGYLHRDAQSYQAADDSLAVRLDVEAKLVF